MIYKKGLTAMFKLEIPEGYKKLAAAQEGWVDVIFSVPCATEAEKIRKKQSKSLQAEIKNRAVVRTDARVLDTIIHSYSFVEIEKISQKELLEQLVASLYKHAMVWALEELKEIYETNPLEIN
jgi:hypothetical protein